ncbi:MAG TPA: Lrp/AsnC ligand binding domain-containing protein [Nitrosopumilaceae archaeon]|nr:Lrp/AsnC ligand binding domain-containing protein [Nitrosopumilaceae archaeon]
MGTYGVYDLFVKVQAQTSRDVEHIITHQIRKIKNVLSTTTLSVIPEQGGK